MNKVFLLGRLTKNPQSGVTNSDKMYARFSLAVNGFGDRVDYLNVVTWEKTAEAVMKYLTKGKQVLVEGSIQVGSYEYKGEKRATFDIKADRIEFVGSKDTSQERNDGPSVDELTPCDDDDMPF